MSTPVPLPPGTPPPRPAAPVSERLFGLALLLAGAGVSRWMVDHRRAIPALPITVAIAAVGFAALIEPRVLRLREVSAHVPQRVRVLLYVALVGGALAGLAVSFAHTVKSVR